MPLWNDNTLSNEYRAFNVVIEKQIIITLNLEIPNKIDSKRLIILVKPGKQTGTMLGIRSKKKFIIKSIDINQPERHRQFIIKLPTGVKKVKAIIITTSQQ